MTQREKTFGELLQEARSQRKKLLKEVGEHIGKSVTYVSDLEHGRKRPPELQFVEKLEQFLGVMDGRLSKAASTERWKLPKDIIRQTQRRQVIQEMLLRANDMSDEQIRKWLDSSEGVHKDG